MPRRRLFTPAHRPLARPADGRRLLRRPDLRHLGSPRLSGEPLADEVDHDDLIIHKAYRTYDDSSDGANVRYFVFEFSQRNPGDTEWFTGVKVVRLLRLTRVPRYLRAGSSSGLNLVFAQQRDVLAALREQQVLFLNLIAKSKDLPMAFCYGTQAVAATFEDAASRCDESFGVLRHQLYGTYQQLAVKPLSVDEGERLAQYQTEWRHVAMARGRPKPAAGTLGASALLDGNRTDVESANNQLEVLLRGMAEAEFMLSLVTVPLSPAEMSLAWRNLAQKLSEVRSDQQGARAVSAGVALPLTLGTSFGQSHGDTHGTTHAAGVGDSHGVSQSVADSHTVSASEGATASVTDGVSHATSVGHTDGVTQSVSEAVGVTDSVATSHGESASVGETASQSQTLGHTVGASETVGQSASMTEGLTASAGRADGLSHGVSHGESATAGLSHSLTEGQSVTEGQSLGASQTSSANWSNSVSEQFGANLSRAEGWSQTLTEQLSQSFTLGSTEGDTASGSQTHTDGSDVSGGILGFSGGGSVSDAFGMSEGISFSDSLGMGLTSGGSEAAGVSGTETVGLSETAGRSESLGGAVGQTATATNSVGASSSLSQSQAASETFGRSATETMAASQTLSQGLSASQQVGQGVSHQAGVTRSASLGETVGRGQTLTHGQTAGLSQGTSLSRSGAVGSSASSSVSSTESLASSRSTTEGVSRTAGESVGRTVATGETAGVASNQSLSDAYMVAMSRTAATTGSLGAVPSVGVSITRQTFDESKRMLGDVLESQMRRFVEGMESGAYLYQLFVTAPDRTTLLGAAGLLKSAFWGAGDADSRIAQPFHTIVDFDDDERDRLLDHARCFTSYRRREPVTEEISPFLYSSYITPTELSAFTHPPTANALGLEAQFDSTPVLAMPSDRTRRQLYLGQLFDGERAQVSSTRVGVDVDELTHTLISGATGSGKTTTLMRMLTELTQVEREIHDVDAGTGAVTAKPARAGILGLDWMRNMRNLASIVEPERFRFYSVSRPALGEFRWNLLAIPHHDISPAEWLNQMADNMVASWSLGEFGRSLVAEFLNDLYGANRLTETVLLPEVVNDDGSLARDAIVLDPVDRSLLPDGAIQIDANGDEFANVFTYPELSRLISIEHLAIKVMAKVEELATTEGARLHGTSMRDRLQSLWRRVSYFAPNGALSDLFGCDPSLDERTTLSVGDLIDPDQGLVTVIETDGLDMANRRLVLGSVLLAVYRHGLATGEGCFDHAGQGPGTYVVLEESHELFGEQAAGGDDRFSAETRTALYESLFRRARALGLRLVAVAQNPGSLPVAITSNTSTVFVHRVYDSEDRKRCFDLLNWSNQVSQQQREWRWLGEMPQGYTIVRLHSRAGQSYLASAPFQMVTEPAPLELLSDAEMARLAAERRRPPAG